MAFAHQYDRLIVQSLVGNATWSSSTAEGSFFHVGTVPDRQLRTFVADLRMMICSTPHGYAPVALYARRSRKPLQASPTERPDGMRPDHVARATRLARTDIKPHPVGVGRRYRVQ